MNQPISIQKSQAPIDANSLEAAILYGDLSKLNANQRVEYVGKLCAMTGLNPLTKPFEFMTLQGRMVCYAGKNCAEQLRKVHSVSLRVVAREKIDDVYVVTAEASLPNGRVDSATGAVPLLGLKGDALANAMMKAETKAKRRVTLSICSLGMLDETEVETISSNPSVRPDQPGPNDGNTTEGDWKFSFGKWKQRTIEEVYNDPKNGPQALAGYIQYLESSSEKSGKPLSDSAIDCIKRIEEFLGALENTPMEETVDDLPFPER